MDIRINTHSSIRVEGEKVVYFDPYNIKGETHDADIIFITHSHYDHLSGDDISKIIKPTTVTVLPAGCEKAAEDNGLDLLSCIFMKPGQMDNVRGLSVTCVPAYNIGKKYHKMKEGWLGYVVTVGGRKVYVMGDTDDTPYARAVECDVCLVPCGGTYTMDYEEASDFINETRPAVAIPTHYGTVAGDKEDGLRFKERIEEGIDVVLLVEE